MQRPYARIFFFCSLNGCADGLGQARLRHLPRYVDERHPGEFILLCHLLRHTCIMARAERQKRSIQTSTPWRASN